MLLPAFEYLEPKNLADALQMLELYGADCKILAGGTDLLVRMKHRLLTPKYLMSLRMLKDLSYIRQDNGKLIIGAGTSLSAICESEAVQKYLPALFQAIQSVGAVSIQHYRGTIGGNLCQDGRCLYYNQSAFWRSGKPPCHKAGGKTCYARESSDRCHATFQSDGATALVALNAEVTLTKSNSTRTIPLADLYSAQGEYPLTIAPDEILTEIRVPIYDSSTGSSYKRLAYRSAIDYPIAAVGAWIQTSDNQIKSARIVIGAIGRAPILMADAANILTGKSIYDQNAVEKVAKAAMNHAEAFAVENVGSKVEYRVKMIYVLTQRAIRIFRI